MDFKKWALFREMSKIVIGVASFYFFLIVGFLIFFGLHDTSEPADFILILGNQVNEDGSMSDRLRARLEEGVASYKQGLGKKIVVSGGIDQNGQDEAAVMARFLENNLVPKSDILLDSTGYTTRASAQNMRAIADLDKMPDSSVLVVSQYFHMARSVEILQSCGFKTIFNRHARYVELRDVYSLFREFFAWHSYKIKGCK